MKRKYLDIDLCDIVQLDVQGFDADERIDLLLIGGQVDVVVAYDHPNIVKEEIDLIRCNRYPGPTHGRYNPAPIGVFAEKGGLDQR